MATEKIQMRYVIRKASGYYYNPTKAMRAAGFRPEPLGADPIAAAARADKLNNQWDDIRRDGDGEAPPRPGTIGALIAQLRTTEEWKTKSDGRRANLERSFALFKDAGFIATRARDVTPTDCETFYAKLGALGVTSRHDVYRDLRYLFNYAGRVRFDKLTKADNPTYAVRNAAPAPRQQKWETPQVAAAIAAGWDAGYHGAAVALAIMYDTSMRPVDVRALPPEHVDLPGAAVRVPAQSKTGNPHWAPLWPATVAMIRRYQAIVTSLPGAPIIRTRTGRPYSKLQLARDVRAVMTLAGIPKDIQGRDLRRTAQYERATSGATAMEAGAAAGQKVTSSQRIIDTYVPADFELAKRAQKKRGTRLK